MLEPVQDEVKQAKLLHRRTPTAEDFPLPLKQPFVVTGVNRRDQGLVSPSKSSLTVSDDDHFHAISTPPSMDNSPIVRENSQKSRVVGAYNNSNVDLHKELSKKKNQFYIDTLPLRKDSFTPHDRIHKESIILAEVKTNIIVGDEFDFLNEFSQHLSQRYQKPTSSIFITLDHSACLLYASSFDSAYILTITALPSQIQPAANKRNAALIQSFMTASLGVLPDRGVIKFIGIPDECFATEGITIQGQIDRSERSIRERSSVSALSEAQAPPASIANTNSQPQTHSQSQSHFRPQQQPQSILQPPPRRLGTRKGKPPALSLVQKSQSMPGSRMPSPIATGPVDYDESSILPAIPIPAATVPTLTQRKAERVQKMSKRKSILAIFGRG